MGAQFRQSLKLPLIFAPALALLFPQEAATAAATQPEDAWELASRMMFNEAASAFSAAARSAEGIDDLGRFYLALSLLNVQPRSAGNIDRARSLFRDLAGRAADTEFRVGALYYLARIEEVHALTPRPDRAKQDYLAIWRDHSDSFFGQFAFLKHLSLAIYHSDADYGLVDELRRLESESRRLTAPFLRNIYHLIMAEGYSLAHPAWETETLEHLVAADVIGFKTDAIQADVLYKIAELAGRLGKPELAHRAYVRFLSDFPRDVRTMLVRSQLESLRLSETTTNTASTPTPGN